MRFDGILFDLDGTLVDSVEDMYMALNLTLSEFAHPIVSHSLVREWVGNGIDMLVKRGLSGSHEVSGQLSDSLADKAIERFKIHYDELVGQYAGLYPHVETGLSAFATVPKAIVTNKNRAFTLKLLDKLSLTSHFDCIICGDDTDKKPSPAPLLLAAERLGIATDKLIMVGDSKSDILAAQGANIPVIAVNYGYNQGFDLKEFNPQYLCDGFLDIIPIINQR
ncbi:HAD-IA family hydrolase [Pseudoalteromonas piscicida]|uniref:phosphoglycolate phosphatase n=1 Tax=Pseudoalteromonas piscicida TaxID=43662 RepID=A0A2A5JVV1_PSEO7|nr:HAD-IA family hydrolase [Pseudoalteromonas piscicida]PCK33476.1 phosphoglycolate phosphatase [Pseudoalteromonas piscicida]